MSTATSSAQSMRQQLDDLDALLQRMLALPINQLDDPPVIVGRMNLGPHLSGNFFVCCGQPGDSARLIDGVRERLFTIDMLAQA